jgi:hypothetical protein
MRRRRNHGLGFAPLFLTLIFMISVCGCSSITLMAPYEQKIDEGVTSLQKMTAEFFTRVERQGGSRPEDYKNHTKFYDDAKVAVSGLVVRAGAVARNKQTLGQLEVLRQQFKKLEEDHQRIGIPLPAIDPYQTAFNRTFTAILTLEAAKKKPDSGGAGQ